MPALHELDERDDDDLDRLYSIDNAAERLDVSTWAIRSWIKKKKIKSTKLGSRRLIARSELRRIISEGVE